MLQDRSGGFLRPFLAVALVVALGAAGLMPLRVGPARAATDGGGEDEGLSCELPGVDDRCEEWEFLYTEPGNPYFRANMQAPSAIAFSPNGETIYRTFTDIHQACGADSCIYWWKTLAIDSATGTQLWSNEFWGSGEWDMAWPSDIAVSPDGATIYVTGYRRTDEGWQHALVWYDAATGAEMRVATRRARIAHVNVTRAQVEVSPDGAVVYTSGAVPVGTDAFFAATEGYAADSGERLFSERVAAPDGTGPVAMVLDPLGRTLYVAVTGFKPPLDLDYAVVAYDVSGPEPGKVVWTSSFGSPENSDIPVSMGISADGGRLFVTGRTRRIVAQLPSPVPPALRTFASLEYATVAYDAGDGTELWTARYAPPGSNRVMAMAVAGEQVIVTGNSTASQNTATHLLNTFDGVYATVAYDAATGQQIWVALPFLAPGAEVGTGMFGVRSIAASPDGGRVYITGRQCKNDNPCDQITIAYDALSGAQIWIARYNHTGADFQGGVVIGANPDGSAVVVGGAASRATDPSGTGRFHDLTLTTYGT